MSNPLSHSFSDDECRIDDKFPSVADLTGESIFAAPAAAMDMPQGRGAGRKLDV